MQLSQSIVSMALRSVTLISKLVLLVAITRFLSEDQVGSYGLLVGAINIALAIVGFAFYNYTQRHYMGANLNDKAHILLQQGAFHLVLYALCLPLSLLIFYYDILPWEQAHWFYLLLIGDHFCAETYRVALFNKRPVLANAGLFIRGGLWAYVAAALIWLEPEQYGLDVIWQSWAVCLLLASAFYVWPLRALPWRAAFKRGIDWSWIKRGIYTSSYYMVCATSQRAVQYLDVFFLSAMVGLAQTGIYVFYIGLYRAMQNLVRSGVSTILLPHMVESVKQGDRLHYHKLQVRLLVGTCLALGAVIAAVFLALPYLLDFIGRESFANGHSVLLYLIPALCVSCLGDGASHALYVHHKDRLMMITDVVALVVFCISNLLLIPTMQLQGAALSVLIAASALFLMRVILAWRLSGAS